MIFWNYRIIRHHIPEWYGLHEVYYNGGGIDTWTSKPADFVAVSEPDPREAIIESLEQALRDARKYPVLVERDGKLVEE